MQIEVKITTPIEGAPSLLAALATALSNPALQTNPAANISVTPVGEQEASAPDVDPVAATIAQAEAKAPSKRKSKAEKQAELATAPKVEEVEKTTEQPEAVEAAEATEEVEEATEEAVGITFEEVRAKATEKASKKRDEVKALIGKYVKSGKLSELAMTDYASFMSDLNKL